MKRLYPFLIALLFIQKIAPVSAQTKVECVNFAEEIYDQLNNRQFDSIIRKFSPSLTQTLDSTRLSNTWVNMLQMYGEIKHHGQPFIEKNYVYHIATIPVHYEKVKAYVKITFDSLFSIYGLLVSPCNNNYSIPEYANTLAFDDTIIPFGVPEFPINGVLSLPSSGGKFPLVIIIHDTGPWDKDGTFGPNQPYKDFAWGLATNGVAVFRYDKRTFIHGATLYANPKYQYYTIEEEIIEDALEALKVMSKHPSIDASNIYILGHGQGGMVAPLIVKKSKSVKVKGIVMAAANARPIQQLMIDQMHFLYDSTELNEGQRGNMDVIIAKAEYAMRKDLKPDMPDYLLPSGVAAPYWIYINKYDQVKTAQKLKQMPMLFLQGERDYQVPRMTDFNIWKTKMAENKRASFIAYPNLNHLFLPGEGRPRRQEFATANNVALKVILDISQWIKALQ